MMAVILTLALLPLMLLPMPYHSPLPLRRSLVAVNGGNGRADTLEVARWNPKQNDPPRQRKYKIAQLKGLNVEITSQT